jgi:tRNA 2-selenouridine synthase
VLGGLPDVAQPSQKRFETRLWDALRGVDTARPVFVESESRKVGACQVPDALIGAIRRSGLAVVEAGVDVRARFPARRVRALPARPGDAVRAARLPDSAARRAARGRLEGARRRGRWEEFVARLLVEHYDPSYDRSMRRNFAALGRLAPRAPGRHRRPRARARGRARCSGWRPNRRATAPADLSGHRRSVFRSRGRERPGAISRPPRPSRSAGRDAGRSSPCA